jgi:CheY-like chemotaxis protein
MLGLLTEGQVQECCEDGEFDPHDPPSILRVMERKGFLTSWQSQKLLKGDKDGFLIGGYRLLYKISSGSFGRVYRADDPRTGRVVAVKVLRQRWSENTHSVELFEREGKVGLSLKHPNIVEILAVDRDPSTKQYYIVMEFIEGGNLRDFLGIRKKLIAKEALRLIEDAAAGLAHAYSRGLTHRDLKPSNMLISSQGAIKLVDFGLAGVYSEMPGHDEGKIERTVDYAGLETATGVPPGDVRSDIYFLGCVLYEMLTGRPPLTMTKDKTQRMQRSRFDSVVKITPVEVRAPASVFRLVETMMALEPLHRYQTPNQLLEAIRDVRRELAGGAPAVEKQAAAVNRVIFVIEGHEKLQDAIRNKFKEVGYRVLMSAEPSRAFQRFQQQPFDALIMDAGTVGEDGLTAFRHILEESDRRRFPCGCVLILNEDQASWTERLNPHPRMAVLVRPVTLRQLYTKVDELINGATPEQG